MLAANCYRIQRFVAGPAAYPAQMDKRSVSQVLADNLSGAMRAADEGRGITQSELSRRSGVPQRTISLYLSPQSRASSEPAGGATIERIALLAGALKVPTWQLLHPDPEQIRKAIDLYDLIGTTLAPDHLRPSNIRRLK